MQINERALWCIRNDIYHLARKGVLFWQHIVEFILDARDMFPELEHLVCRRMKLVRTDDRNRREFRVPRGQSLRQIQQPVNAGLI